MKKWLLHIMFVSVLGMLAASCSQDADDPTQTADSRKAQVVFTLTLNKGNGSRAITNPNWKGTYDKEDGVGVDNLINNLQVLFFGTTDGKYIGNVQDAIFYEQSEGVYEFIGEISIDAGYVTTNANGTLNLNAKMMVLANCTDITLGANSTYADVQALPYDGATSPSQIPMWGIQTINNTPITVGARNELNDIDLLRAMAKVEVIMAAEGYTMENIILNRYNTKGYCAPGLGESTWADVGATADLATESCVNYNTTATGEVLTVAGTNKRIEFYIPECANSTENPLSMYVNIKKGTTDVDANLTDANLYFKDYTDDAPFNIVRNHIYRYTITAVKTGFDLKLTVAPWTDVQQSFNYEDELSYDDGSWINATVTTDEQEREIVSLKTAATADATDVTAVYNFNINTPQTIEWMAVLEDPEGKFQFDMSQTSGKGTVEGDNSIQRTVRGELLVTGSNLNLGVKAIDPSESGQYEAILRVYVMYGGKTFELDLTDGEEAALNHFTIQHSKL